MTATDSPTAKRTAPSEPVAERRRPPIPLIVLGILVVIGAIFGWRRFQYSRTHVSSDNAQIDSHITAIAPRVQAFVSKVFVDDHQQVRAGDTLAILDDRDFKVKLAQAEAELASARAAFGGNRRAGQAEAERAASLATAASAQANVDAAQANLRKTTADLERYKTLAANKVISAQQLDQAQWAVDNARATLEAAQKQAAAASSQSVGADAGVRIAAARLTAAETAVENARLQLGYTVLTAPVAGTIAKRTVEPGALVQVGQNLMVIVPNEQLWITANLKETDMGRIKVGNEVEFSVDAYPGIEFRGTVESLSPATGARFALLPPDNATGNFTKVVQRVPVRIRIEGNDPNHPLRPGLSVDVSIKTS